MSQPPPHSRLVVTAVVTFYLIAATVMVFANKWVLNTNAPPLFFLCLQLYIAVILLWLINLFKLIKLPNIQFKVLKPLLPLISINVAGLSFNNYCLKYIDASFYQVARGLILPMTVIISYIFLKSRPSNLILMCCVIICIGFFVSIHPNKNSDIDFKGVVFGLLSSLTTAGHAVIIKYSLPVVDNSTITLAYYVNAFSALAFIPLFIIFGEFNETLDLITSPIDDQNFFTFIMGTLITGIVGFLICIAGFLSIKVTSPITHMVSAAIRSVLMVLLGVILFNDKLTTSKLISISIIVAGSLMYTYIKDKENKRNENGNIHEHQPLETVNVRRSQDEIIFEANIDDNYDNENIRK